MTKIHLVCCVILSVIHFHCDIFCHDYTALCLHSLQWAFGLFLSFVILNSTSMSILEYIFYYISSRNSLVYAIGVELLILQICDYSTLEYKVKLFPKVTALIYITTSKILEILWIFNTWNVQTF